MQVGFIGIGNMGYPMAANLARAGHSLVVHDADRTRGAHFVQDHGGQTAVRLGEVALCDVVVTMLPTGEIVREVLTELEGGVFVGTAREGLIVVDMSSSDPVGTRTLGAVLKRADIALIDAPVSGGVPRAASGTLAIMIGGDDAAAIARVKPLLASMGDRLFETGPLGSGHAMKALNNYAAAASYVAVAEALLVGARFGLDQNKMVEIMNVSTGRNFHTDLVFRQHVLSGAFATGFSVGLLAKDVKIAADLGSAVGIDAPMLRLVRDRWAAARDRLGAHRDNSEAITAWDEELSGATRQG
jgi:3-hydroxyisobutyrate dehydrogenase